MPIASPAQDAIRALGLDKILDLIESGQSQVEIARSLNISVASLNAWLNRDPIRSARTRLAMIASAEGWQDRGLQYVLEAPSDNAEIQRARVLEQHCARRAAIRNPMHRDKVSIEHSKRQPGDYAGMSDAELLSMASNYLAIADTGQADTDQSGTDNPG